MSQRQPDDRQMRMARLVALSQIGVEMVAPIGLGVLLDLYMDWGPWAAIAGALIGFGGGMFHLIFLVNQSDRDSQS